MTIRLGGVQPPSDQPPDDFDAYVAPHLEPALDLTYRAEDAVQALERGAGERCAAERLSAVAHYVCALSDIINDPVMSSRDVDTGDWELELMRHREEAGVMLAELVVGRETTEAIDSLWSAQSKRELYGSQREFVERLNQTWIDEYVPDRGDE